MDSSDNNSDDYIDSSGSEIDTKEKVKKTWVDLAIERDIEIQEEKSGFYQYEKFHVECCENFCVVKNKLKF
jgi:hypothetical protein